MRILLIKTSSMGDLIHTLPALTDAGKAIPGIRFDWVVEDAFKEIPAWHPLVERVIPIAFRRWRKNLTAPETRAAFKSFRQQLKNEKYDLILDAQGLVKSAILGFLAKGERAGLDWGSAREPLASLAYQRKANVNFHQHAISRMRQLFSQSLHYPLPTGALDFGIPRDQFPAAENNVPYLVFLHGTTWNTKQWPESYWLALAKHAASAGYRIKIGGGNPAEVARAERIAGECSSVDLVPYLTIAQMATLLAHAKGAVAVDTGFGHLAGALDLPLVSIYGATNPDYTGALGNRSLHLTPRNFACAPCLSRACTYKAPSAVTPACYETIAPQRVWETMMSLIGNEK